MFHELFVPQEQLPPCFVNPKKIFQTLLLRQQLKMAMETKIVTAVPHFSFEHIKNPISAMKKRF